MNPTEKAKAYALDKTGLNWAKLDKWSDADRRAYLAAIAEFRQRNPGLFTPAELAAAGNYQSTADATAPEFSYVKEFGKELGARVEKIGNQVAGVGEGIFSGLSLMRWLIPVAVVVGVGLWLWKFAGSPSIPRRRA
jgi:hypothetical protein